MQMRRCLKNNSFFFIGPYAGLQIYGGPGSLSHDFKIWGFTVCGCIGPGREREKRKKREGRGFVSGPVGGRLACLCPGSLV